MSASVVPLTSNSDADWRRRSAQATNALREQLADVGTTAQRPAHPDIGQMRYNTTTGKPEWFNGSAWRDATGTIV